MRGSGSRRVVRVYSGGSGRVRARGGSGRVGFTLLEMLISIALILALFSSMFGFLYGMLTTRARVLELTDQQRAAALLIDRLEADLLTCIAGDARHGAGVAGDEHSLRLLVRSAWPVGDDDAAFGDLQRAEYRFDVNRHELSGSRGPAGQSRTDSHSFGARLYKVRFRYYDGSDWLSSFDSLQRDQLPLAVEVAIWFDPWPGEDWNEAGDDDPATIRQGEGLSRETFDSSGTFDEHEWAMRADRDFQPEPVPDRVRVIAVVDAAGGEDE